jgi:hypothetical protein
MQKALLKVFAVLGVIWFWFWAGLGAIGNVQTAAYLAQHHDVAGLLAKTPPVIPGLAGLILAIVLCVLLLREPQQLAPQANILMAAPAPPPRTPPVHTALAVEQLAPIVPSKVPVSKTEQAKIRPAKGSSARIFVPQSVKELTALFDQHTNVQARKLFESYTNKWIRVKGFVSNISLLGDGDTMVAIRLQKASGLPLATCTFGAAWHERLNIIAKDSEIEVIGRISNADSMALYLVNCELEY